MRRILLVEAIVSFFLIFLVVGCETHETVIRAISESEETAIENQDSTHELETISEDIESESSGIQTTDLVDTDSVDTESIDTDSIEEFDSLEDSSVFDSLEDSADTVVDFQEIDSEISSEDLISDTPEEDTLVSDLIQDEIEDEEIEDSNSSPEWWGQPVESPADQWTWIDFHETRCANGSPTGLGLNLYPGATMAFIYLEGGGACWNYGNCLSIVDTSLHLNGFDEDNFAGIIAGAYLNSPIFDRENPINPFAQAHYVFVPYCTGDVHSGNALTELTGTFSWQEGWVYFYGNHNLKEYLKRLVPTFQDVELVVLSGSSAGGFGAGLSWWEFVGAFDPIQVYLLDDSGPPIEAGEGLWEQWVEVWNMQLPQDCVNCRENVGNIMDYYRATLLLNNRMGLMSYTKDSVISGFFGLFPFIFEERLLQLANEFDEEENAHYFIVNGRLHTMMILGFENTESENGLPLWRWVEQMVEDDPDWTSYRP